MISGECNTISDSGRCQKVRKGILSGLRRGRSETSLAFRNDGKCPREYDMSLSKYYRRVSKCGFLEIKGKEPLHYKEGPKKRDGQWPPRFTKVRLIFTAPVDSVVMQFITTVYLGTLRCERVLGGDIAHSDRLHRPSPAGPYSALQGSNG